MNQLWPAGFADTRMHDRPARPTAFCWNQKYPRVCGEKSFPWMVRLSFGGSPPRMRGKANQPQKGGAAMRITPAYAGKSFCISLQVHYGWDHPRICGEKPAGEEPTFCPKGSPPRMRGKVKRQQATAPPGQDHPCVCGEKYRMKPNRVCGLGSPPRMRGKDALVLHGDALLGITPAYAGKSCQSQ